MASQQEPINYAISASGSSGVSAELSDQSVVILDRRLREILTRAQREIEQVLEQLQSDDSATSATSMHELKVLLQVRQQLKPAEQPQREILQDSASSAQTHRPDVTESSRDRQKDLLGSDDGQSR